MTYKKHLTEPTLKSQAKVIFDKHLPLAKLNGTQFRKTVMAEIESTLNVKTASSAALYNACKKAMATPIESLGRTSAPAKHKAGEFEVDDTECFTVLEMLHAQKGIMVGRSYPYMVQGDASEDFDMRVEKHPEAEWIMIKGLGMAPHYKHELQVGEFEIKRYTPTTIKIVEVEQLLED